MLKCGTALRVSGAAREDARRRLEGALGHSGAVGGAWGENEYFTRRNGRFDATGEG